MKKDVYISDLPNNLSAIDTIEDLIQNNYHPDYGLIIQALPSKQIFLSNYLPEEIPTALKILALLSKNYPQNFRIDHQSATYGVDIELPEAVDNMNTLWFYSRGQLVHYKDFGAFESLK